MKLKYFMTIMVLCYWVNYSKAQDILQSYIDSAVKNNPSLHVYRLNSNALNQRKAPAKSLPDPVLFGGIMNLPTDLNFGKDMMTMEQIGVQQNFSVSRKYAIQGDMAQADYEASGFDYSTKKLWLIAEVKRQYFDIYAQDKKIETAQKSIETLNNYLGIAGTRYSSGLATQHDFINAQLAITNMQESLIKMKSEKQEMIVSFNTLLARNVADSVQVNDNIDFQPFIIQKDSLLVIAFANNPVLLASRKMIEKDSLNYLLTKTNKIPEFNGSLWYGKRQAIDPEGNKASDMLGLSFGMTLPVYSKQKQDPLIAESDFNFQKSQYQYQSLTNEIRQEITQAYIELDKNSKLVSIYKNQLIPETQQSLDAGLIGYQENKIDFLTLTSNFLALYNDNLLYYQSIADYLKAKASIEMLIAHNIN